MKNILLQNISVNYAKFYADITYPKHGPASRVVQKVNCFLTRYGLNLCHASTLYNQIFIMLSCRVKLFILYSYKQPRHYLPKKI